jgi:hypothetical protein
MGKFEIKAVMKTNIPLGMLIILSRTVDIQRRCFLTKSEVVFPK